MKALSVGLAVLALGSAAGAYWLGRSSEAAEVEKLSAMQRELASLRGSVDQISSDARRPRAVTRTVIERPAPEPAGSAASREVAAAGDAAPEPGDPTVPVTAEEARDRLGDVYDTEPVDAGWAAATQRDLRGKIEQVMTAESEIESVQCRGTMCRIDMIHRDEQTFFAFFQSAVGSQAVWSGPTFNTKMGETEDGRWITRSYFAREGASLPGVAD